MRALRVENLQPAAHKFRDQRHCRRVLDRVSVFLYTVTPSMAMTGSLIRDMIRS